MYSGERSGDFEARGGQGANLLAHQARLILQLPFKSD